MHPGNRTPATIAHAFVWAAILLAGCEARQEVHQTQWAIVDTGKVRETIRDIVRAQNPYPSELQFDNTEISSQASTARRQISQIKNDAQQRCFAEISKKTGANLNAPPQVPNGVAWENFYRQRNQCNAAGDNDPLLVDLQKKVDEADKKMTSKRAFDSRIDNTASKAVTTAVSTYADGKFDLVIGNRSEIAYNKSQISVDITQAVIDALKQNPPMLTLEPPR